MDVMREGTLNWLGWVGLASAAVTATLAGAVILLTSSTGLFIIALILCAAAAFVCALGIVAYREAVAEMWWPSAAGLTLLGFAALCVIALTLMGVG